ncbi:anaerobic ribonucleoside-triphosphate reductase [Thiothrix winogradskyi]|uniref:Anaerobic ribonucleoside-triphosphate reductase n=1 Tax=Thiothrix winogradskyi TaxID=96472 RepID=A0ABY3SZ38_9GAMM|nr:anaerobic ribonucleoside-triphosphate reductase [Thiothrix winogradskyi]UJS24207.1 anaerobic ribonucleoside-triphosphate reductase [Thiothrix winogradskyi]
MKQQTIKLEDNERQRCEVWTRVMGYHRPVSSFNPGKQSEHAERIPFVEASPLLAGKRPCYS